MGLNRDLEGYLVVSIEQAVAAPYCGLLLADAGARVIKIERPEGDFARAYDAGADGQSAIFTWLNRGKESICLDLKNGADMAVMAAILKKADVLISNLAPGAIDRLGLSGTRLREHNRGLITVMISGYGPTKPAAKLKAYDFLVQAESGVCSVTGTKESPARVGISVGDLATGLTAFSAILRALIQRGKTGEGIDLHISMFDVLADWMNMPLLQHRYAGGAPARSGLQHSFVAPYGAFVCGDGGQVLLSIQNNREWSAFCRDVLQRPELIEDERFKDNPDRFENRAALDAIIGSVFGQFSTPDVMEKLHSTQIANAQLNSVADLSEHRFLRNTVGSIGQSSLSMAALPVQSDHRSVAVAPQLDAHGPAIRAEFGT